MPVYLIYSLQANLRLLEAKAHTQHPGQLRWRSWSRWRGKKYPFLHIFFDTALLDLQLSRNTPLDVMIDWSASRLSSNRSKLKSWKVGSIRCPIVHQSSHEQPHKSVRQGCSTLVFNMKCLCTIITMALWHYGSPNPCRSHPIWSEHLLHCLVDVGRRCLVSTRFNDGKAAGCPPTFRWAGTSQAKPVQTYSCFFLGYMRNIWNHPGIENRSRQRSVLLTGSTADGPGGVRPGEVMTSSRKMQC